MKKQSNIYINIALIIGIGLITPLLYLNGIKSTIATICVLIVLVFAIIAKNRKINIIFIYISLVLLMFALITVLWWRLDVYYAFEPLIFLTSLLLLIVLSDCELKVFIDYATFLMFVVLVFAYFGLILCYYFDVSPVVFDYYGKDKIYYYITTFGVIGRDGFIRPSGIFDEPGAFSFVICSVALARSIMLKNNKTTWILLLMGLITFSVAHIMFIAVFLLLQNSHIKSKLYIIIFMVFLYVLVSIYFVDVYNSLIAYRFEATDSSFLKGDNRTERFLNAMEYLDVEVFLFGLDKGLFTDYHNVSLNYKILGENILSPLVIKGALMSFSFYATIFYLGYIGVKEKKYIVSFSMIILLSQRPYVSVPGYSLWAILPIVLYFKEYFVIESRYRLNKVV